MKCSALETYPSVTSPVEGVALLELPGPNRPSDLSCASRSFCSKTSARRLRKSDRCTRPTVCDFSISSAETLWPAKDRGVEVWLSCSDAMVTTGLVAVAEKYFELGRESRQEAPKVSLTSLQRRT